MISDIMKYWYDLWNTIVLAINFSHCKENDFCIFFLRCNHYGITFLCNLLQVEQCNVMFNVISDIMAHWFEMWNTIVIILKFCTGIGALMFIKTNHYGRKCFSNLLKLVSYYVMFKVISGTLEWNVKYNWDWH